MPKTSKRNRERGPELEERVHSLLKQLESIGLVRSLGTVLGILAESVLKST